MSHNVFHNVPMLSALNEEVLRRLTSSCGFKTFDSGAQIITQQDDSFDVLFLLAGRARVSIYSPSGVRVSFREMTEGMVFGELSAVDELPRSASVEAITKCSVAIMPRLVFLQLLRDQHTFTMAVMIHLTGMIRSLTERVFEFSTMAVRNRVHAELLRLAAPFGGKIEAIIDPSPTHEEIASRISSHREAVSRELARLEHLGVISKQGRLLKINNIGRLKTLVEEGAWE